MTWIFDANSYFVDPTNGASGNDGLTEATAKDTLANAIDLTPPAGSTIFLSGGTHTVAGADTEAIPSGVNLIGGGPDVTTLTGDSESDVDAFISFAGRNLVEGINLVSSGVDSSMVLSTTAAAASDLTLRNCRIKGEGFGALINKPTSGITRGLFEDCVIDVTDDYGFYVLGNTDLVFRNCMFHGANDGIRISPSVTGDVVTCQVIGCTFAMTSAGDGIYFYSSSTAKINGVVQGSTFILGTGYAYQGNGASTGVPALVDAGGNNITDAMVSLTGTATFTRTWTDANNDAIEGGQVGTDTALIEARSAVVDHYYVDPSMADDTENGTTWGTAKKTLAGVLLLTPSAGSTIFLSGGTHTVATGTDDQLPDNVNLIGCGPDVTILTGDSQDNADGFLLIYGENLIEGINLVGAGVDDSDVIQVLGTGPSNLTLKNCKLSGDGSAINVNSPASGLTKIKCEYCSIFTDGGAGLDFDCPVDVVLENCELYGGTTAIQMTPGTAGVNGTIQILNCFFNVTGGAYALYLASNNTGNVTAIIKDSTFIMGTGYACFGSGGSTGIPAIIDAGGNNITDAMVSLSGTATFTRTWSDIINAAVEAGQIGIDTAALLEKRLVSGTCAAGSAATITLDAGGSTVDDFYNGCLVHLHSGTGAGQVRYCEDYTSSKVLTFDTPLETAADATTGFYIYTDRVGDTTLAKGIDTKIDTLTANQPSTLIATGTIDGGVAADEIYATVTFVTGFIATDDVFNNCLIVFEDGQTRFIVDYIQTTPILIWDRGLDVALDADDTFSIYNVISNDIKSIQDIIGRDLIRTNTVATGGTTGINLDTGASAIPDFYKGCLVLITLGAGLGQSRHCTAYNATNKLLTFDEAVTVPVGAGATYVILASDRATNTDAITTAVSTDGVKLHATQTATWAANLVKSAGIMLTGTATGGTVTTLIDTSIDAGFVDHTFNDRIVMFLDGTLEGQAASITGYDSGTRKFTISQVTAAPTSENYIVI